MIIACEQFFEEFITRYDLNIEKINIKVKHMKRVKKVSETIAQKLNAIDKEIQLAGIIGLLHDIGRFYQIEHYNTFDDNKSMDHAEASNIILFKEGYIEKFIPSTREYDEIIKKAIFCHNKFNLPENLSLTEELFCNIIRDADKIDIFRVMGTECFSEVYLEDRKEKLYISDEVKKIFYWQQMIAYNLRESFIDDYVCKLAYTFDFNFEISKKMLSNYGYLDMFHRSFIRNSGIEDKNIISELNHMYEFARENLS